MLLGRRKERSMSKCKHSFSSKVEAFVEGGLKGFRSQDFTVSTIGRDLCTRAFQRFFPT